MYKIKSLKIFQTIKKNIIQETFKSQIVNSYKRQYNSLNQIKREIQNEGDKKVSSILSIETYVR